MLRLYTSLWAIIEAQGVLYGYNLQARNIQPPTRNGRQILIRNIIPPDITELTNAANSILGVRQLLQQTTAFQLLTPLAGDAPQIWQLTQRLAAEAAIWPPDSIHLATALYNGCSMFVTDDADVIDKIECCQQSLIQPYRQNEFPRSPSDPPLPPFIAHGIFRSHSIIPNRRQTWSPAWQALRALQFM